MSLSTPESKAMTGILSDCARFRSGMAALLSSAAMPSAWGFLASAAESMSICLSTMASVSGPSKEILTFCVLGRLFRAGFDGLPELVLEAFRNKRDIGFVRAHQTGPANERANADHDTDQSSFQHGGSPPKVGY